MAQDNREVMVPMNSNMGMATTRVTYSTRINSLKFHGSDVEEDSQEFIDEVYKVLLIMGVTPVEKVELKERVANAGHPDWEKLKVAFLDRFFSIDMREAKKESPWSDLPQKVSTSRNLRKYKYNVRNKAHVEGCICNAHIVEEVSSFCSHYFEPHVYTRHRKVPQNDDGGIGEQHGYASNLSIFTYPGRGFGELNWRYLTEEELKAAHIYILLNCREVQPYVDNFIDSLHQNFPQITEQEVDRKLDEDFASWFTGYARVHIDNQFIKALAEGPCRSVKPYTGYTVNGFKFHTKGRSFSRASNNSGVSMKGTNYSANDNDYYGVLTEILELEYKGSTPIKRTAFFKCEWFDPTPNVGMKLHPQYKLVYINHRKKLM
ncbi:uncharacterized protein [Solanum tuberosum]|uniref:uncharacterized protein n=1 Tax=Solanum tuberosum TaxID=4113 RepID=UPI0003D284D2|nr:PREDICTED: uncharacterized protein LOC102586523 [Solanum tuberosum]